MIVNCLEYYTNCTKIAIIFMEFTISNINKSINDLMRKIGYQPAYFQKPGEVSIVRQTSRNDYPRFHLYIKEARLRQGFGGQASDKGQETRNFTFNLHLDQKKPSYEGQTGHSGDYDGPAVEAESERIKSLLK